MITCIKYTMMRMNNNLNTINPNTSSIHLITLLKHSPSMRTSSMIQNQYSQNYTIFSYHASVSMIDNITVKKVMNTMLMKLSKISSVNQKKKQIIKQKYNTIIVCGNHLQIIVDKLLAIRMHTSDYATILSKYH